jgi:hypothetical protein
VMSPIRSVKPATAPMVPPAMTPPLSLEDEVDVATVVLVAAVVLVTMVVLADRARRAC